MGLPIKVPFRETEGFFGLGEEFLSFGAINSWRAWEAKLGLEPHSETLVQSLRLVAYAGNTNFRGPPTDLPRPLIKSKPQIKCRFDKTIV
jgi:hypothetical protein